ncbi:MAG: hypothetical protein M0R80_01665 [Proteobacteria bacterium]|jgi:hypothetical protein|nr:hypothetical protein [Pseudomonadota bacterium]
MNYSDLSDIAHEQSLDNMTNVPALLSEKDTRAIKTNLQLTRTKDRTFVIVLALHKELGRNALQKIRCECGSPLGGYVYDNVNDCYYVRCVDFLSLSYVPLACLLRMKDNNFWQMYVPLPEALLIRNLSPDASNKLKAFKAVYKDHIFQYVQLIE